MREPKNLQKNINTALPSQELLQENEENCGKQILVVSYCGIVNYFNPPPPLPVHPRPHRHRFRLFEL